MIVRQSGVIIGNVGVGFLLFPPQAHRAQGNRMKADLEGFLADFAAPTGLELLWRGIFPTLKRGANNRCASGAVEGEPLWSTISFHAIALAESAIRMGARRESVTTLDNGVPLRIWEI
jgi:hypothetical protein